jgi:hypothetical protein
VAPLVNDSRPINLLELVGSSYQVGYDYGFLLAEEAEELYDGFIRTLFPGEAKRIAFEGFLDWQFEAFY